MYIDKIYTKLYSNKDWNGLAQLVGEIKQFAMTERDKAALNAKIRLAKDGKLKPIRNSYGIVPNSANTNIIGMVEAAKEGDDFNFNYNKRNVEHPYEPMSYKNAYYWDEDKQNEPIIGDGSWKDYYMNRLQKEREDIHKKNAMRNFQFK